MKAPGESPGPQEPEVKHYRLCCSARLLFSCVCFFAIFNVANIRIGISMTIVCMADADPEDGNQTYVEKRGEFHWSSQMRGYILSTAFYGMLVGPCVGGFLSFRFGGKLILIIGTVSCGATNFLIPELTRISPIFFSVIRLFSGFFCSFVLPSFYELSSHWIVPEERQMLVGGALIGITMSNIFNFPISSLICEYLGWVWLFYIMGIWMIFFGIMCYFLIYNYPEECPFVSHDELQFIISKVPHKVKAKIPWKDMLKSFPIYTYIFVHFCFSYIYLSLVLSLPLIMNEVYLFPLKENGFLSATPFVGATIIRIVLSLFHEKLRVKLKLSKNAWRKICFSVGSSLACSFLFVVTLLVPAYKYYALACFIVVISSLELCITGGYMLSILDLCPSFVNILTGITNAFANTAGLICPVVNGYITQNRTRGEWNVVVYVIIAVQVLATAFYLIFGRNHLLYWGLAVRNPDQS